MTHYDSDALFDYVEGTSRIAAKIERHVAACAACATEIQELRALAAELSDPGTWETASPAHGTEMTGLFQRVYEEEAAAAALCDEILGRPAPWRLHHARKVAGARTAGVVHELLRRMRTTLETSPADALQLTELAVQLATALDAGAHPSLETTIVLGWALRSHGYVLAFTGNYREGLAFADRAKEVLERLPGMEYELARVAMVRAAAIQWVGGAEEAARLLREAGCTFLRYAARIWYVNARIAEGGAVYASGAVEGALEIWRSVEGAPELTVLGAVRLTHNIALALTDLGQAEASIAPALRCIADFERLGHPTERTRSRMLLGRATSAAGRPEEAIAILRQARGEYLALQMVVEAGLCALELAEALLVAEQAAEVPAICREVIAEFTKAGMGQEASVALALLQEALALREATPSVVREAGRALGRQCLFAPGG